MTSYTKFKKKDIIIQYNKDQWFLNPKNIQGIKDYMVETARYFFKGG